MPLDPPRDLDVEIIEIDGEELVVFSWSSPGAPPEGSLREAMRKLGLRTRADVIRTFGG